MKRTIIAIAVSTLSLSAMAQTIPDRPDTSGHNFTYQLPPAPVYIEPDLLPMIGEAPTPPTLPAPPDIPLPIAPVNPVAPVKNYVELNPSTKQTDLPFNYLKCEGPGCRVYSYGLFNGFLVDPAAGNPMLVNHTRAEAEALLQSFKSGLTDPASDFYLKNESNNYDSILGVELEYRVADQIINPNFDYNTQTHKAVVYSGNVFTLDSFNQAQQLLSGTPITIDGTEYTAIIIDGVMVSTEGVYLVDSYMGHRVVKDTTVFSPADFTASSYKRKILEIDTASPGYGAYQQYLTDNAEAMSAYRTAYLKYLEDKEQYPIQSAEYQSALATYQAAQDTYNQAVADAQNTYFSLLNEYNTANQDVIAENWARIQAAQDAYFNSLDAQQSLINESLAGSINHLATTQSIGGGVALGVDSLSIGTGSIASGDGAVAVGNDAWAAGDDSVAMGNNAVAINDGAVAIGGNALAIGGVAIGQGSVSESNLSVAIGTGARAVSSVAVGTGAQAIGTNTTAIGDFAVAAGSLAVSIGANSAALGNNSVAIGANTVAVRPNSVSVGGRQITDVATPTDDADAANKAYVDQAVANVAAPDLSGLESRINSRIKQVEERADAGTAIALAMTPPIALAPGESAVGAGMGAYGSQQAIAVTYAHNIDLSGKPKSWYKEVQFSAGIGAATTGRYGARAGFSFKW